jgi:hypothetical protein
MSDGSLDGTPEGPARKPTPWSVKKIVEQVTGRPLESMQDPPSSRRSSKVAAPAARDPPLERYHEEPGNGLALIVEAPESEESPRSSRFEAPRGAEELSPPPSGKNPSLRAFLPGAPAPSTSGRSARAPTLPITHPLPLEVVEEVDKLRAEEGAPPIPMSEGSHAHKRTELERVYLSYLLMHLDKLTEPALKYLLHAVEEECEERGLSR